VLVQSVLLTRFVLEHLRVLVGVLMCRRSRIRSIMLLVYGLLARLVVLLCLNKILLETHHLIVVPNTLLSHLALFLL